MLCLLCASAIAAGTPRKVLVLYSFDDQLPWQAKVREGMLNKLAEIASLSQVTLFEERFDGNRMPVDDAAWVTHLQQKYGSIPLDLVIGESNISARILRNNPKLFAPAARVLVNPGTTMGALGGTEVVPIVEDFETNIRFAVGQHPKARKLLVIGNLSPARTTNPKDIWEKLYKNQLALETWSEDFTFAELYQRISTVSEDTVVFYSLVNHDSTGARANPVKVLKELAARSPVPIYATHDTLLGSGALGGYLFSGERVGAAMAELAMGIDPLSFQNDYFSRYMFDARALARWKVDEAQLPADSVIRFREVPVWRQYGWPIFFTALFVVVQTVILLFLANALRGRRAALQALAAQHALLEHRVIERTQELAKANEELSHISTSDSLTQLPNRRRFDEVLKLEFERAKRTGSPLSLVMLDIDFFKRYNDTYGHVRGDECLFAVAQAISGAFARSVDMAARYGGEEFAVILPETDMAGALAMAERLRERIASLGIAHGTSDVADHVTASLGVATLLANGNTSAGDLVQRADEQLYLAKSRGRNKVAVTTIEPH